MSFYLDANILVALLTPEPLSERADNFVQSNVERLIVSDFAAAEFVSAIARRVRTRETTVANARKDLADFEVWTARFTDRTDLNAGDVAAATAYMRRLDLTLLTPDALHIAIAGRVDATLVTFDRAMAAAVRALGMAVVTP
ncbi:MAG: type II toxin-antitoxin system VapC family toxin [Stellaceae bacterium]